MQKKTDRRVRKTKTQLRNGLAMLMKEKSVGEITVKELVDQVDINRSTFYLHYPDISGLLYEIENDLSEEMERAIREHPIEKREDNGFYFLQDIFQTLWLFHHAAARVSIEQSGKAVLHIIEPALNDLRLRIRTIAFVILIPRRLNTPGGSKVSSPFFGFFFRWPRPPISKVRNSRPLST